MRRALALLALLPLCACGSNLLVRRMPAAVVLPGGAQRVVVLEVRPAAGLLQPDYDAPTHRWLLQSAVAVVCEPLDLVFSTGAAVAAAFDDAAHVRGGPLGWLWAMTPFATLVAMSPAKVPFHVTAEQWADLSSDDRRRRVFAASRIWVGDNVRDVTIRAGSDDR